MTDLVINARFGRSQSRGDADHADRPLPAMKKELGGHDENK